jgi:chlorite dismutase
MGARYLFVYPFVKTRAWYALPLERRQQIMNEHIRIGHKYPRVRLNTTYSFGLDDQEFVLAFESDHPADFLDLVMELRESEASQYTLRDTPIFTCVKAAGAELLKSLGVHGAGGGTSDPWSHGSQH